MLTPAGPIVGAGWADRPSSREGGAVSRAVFRLVCPELMCHQVGKGDFSQDLMDGMLGSEPHCL